MIYSFTGKIKPYVSYSAHLITKASLEIYGLNSFTLLLFLSFSVSKNFDLTPKIQAEIKNDKVFHHDGLSDFSFVVHSCNVKILISLITGITNTLILG